MNTFPPLFIYLILKNLETALSVGPRKCSSMWTKLPGFYKDEFHCFDGKHCLHTERSVCGTRAECPDGSDLAANLCLRAMKDDSGGGAAFVCCDGRHLKISRVCDGHCDCETLTRDPRISVSNLKGRFNKLEAQLESCEDEKVCERRFVCGGNCVGSNCTTTTTKTTRNKKSPTKSLDIFREDNEEIYKIVMIPLFGILLVCLWILCCFGSVKKLRSEGGAEAFGAEEDSDDVDDDDENANARNEVDAHAGNDDGPRGWVAPDPSILDRLPNTPPPSYSEVVLEMRLVDPPPPYSQHSPQV